mmetsp:Transcript_59638/g.144072  ORF Transcript_59638/g.144072 Transcript_59638/m.144072 type:complete len:95 (+) Transcript_59638:3338-3622(+)
MNIIPLLGSHYKQVVEIKQLLSLVLQINLMILANLNLKYVSIHTLQLLDSVVIVQQQKEILITLLLGNVKMVSTLTQLKMFVILQLVLKVLLLL